MDLTEPRRPYATVVKPEPRNAGLGAFATPNSLQHPNPNPGQFRVGNVRVRGSRLYLAYGSDGVRVVDISEPTQPKEIGHYVLNAAAVWDALEHEGLVLARDDKGGLWIFQDVP